MTCVSLEKVQTKTYSLLSAKVQMLSWKAVQGM